MQYRREIDGLRAIAVLPVILFHAGLRSFSGGFVGVDVFFVISGYLITTIILSEKEKNTFSLFSFYERRARRILPALFLVMFFCIPAAWLFLQPNHLKDFFQSLVAVPTFSSNILFLRESGYFGVAAELKPLLHTWSLAIEEQYYVLFPLFLMFLWRFRRRWIFGSLAVIALSSLALAQWGAYHRPLEAFYLFPTRGWEIAIGSLIAFYFLYKKDHGEFVKSHKIACEILGFIGLGLIFYAVFAFNKRTPFPSFYTLAPTLGAGLVIVFTSSQTVVGRILGTKPLVGIGLISYSAYLWHYPLFVFARHKSFSEPGVGVFLVLALVSVALAYLCWRYIEKPFRDRQFLSRKKVFGFAAFVSLAFVSVGLTGHFKNGFRDLWFEKHPYIAAAYKLIEKSYSSRDYVEQPNECRFRVAGLNDEIAGQLKDCAARYGEGFVVLGDSHAMDLFGALVSNSDERFIFGLSKGACRPHTKLPGCQYDDFLKFVIDNPHVFKEVIYEQAGFYLIQSKNGKDGSRAFFNRIDPFKKVPDYFPHLHNIHKVAEYLSKVSRYVPVVWLGPRLEPHIGTNYILKNGCKDKFKLRPNLEENFSKLDRFIQGFINAENVGDVSYISQIALTNFDINRDFLTCQSLYWTDGDHWSAAGEQKFGAGLVDSLLVPKQPNMPYTSGVAHH